MKENQILILHFLVNHMINFIEEHNLMKHRLVKQALKSALKTLNDILVAQMDVFIKGSAQRPLESMENEAADQLQYGTLAIEEYFKLQFSLGEMPIETQDKFILEYNQLLKKYEI